MKDNKQNLYATIITVIISLIAIVTAFGGFMSNQAKLEVQLAGIQKELVTINEKLDKRDEEIKVLQTEIAVIKEQIKK